MTSGKRIKWLDFAKGIAILSVVMGHTITHGMFDFDVGKNLNWLISLQFILFIFVMPCFFVISGYLYKPTKTLKTYLLLIYKKITSIFLPYVFFSFFVFCINDFHEIKDLHKFIGFHQFLIRYVYDPNGYLWFLYALFIIFIIIGALDLIKLNNFWQFVICVILLYFQLTSSWKVGKQPQCGICSFILFFWIGKVWKQYNDISKYIKKYLYIILVMGVFSSVVLIYVFNHFSSTAFINNDSNNISYMDFIPKLLSVPILFWISRVVERYKIFSLIFKYFDKYGKCTLIIYLVHYFPAVIIGHILSRFSLNPVIDFVILFIVVWYLCIAIWYLSTKMNIINFIFYPRSYINKLVIKTKWGKRLLK